MVWIKVHPLTLLLAKVDTLLHKGYLVVCNYSPAAVGYRYAFDLVQS